MYKPLFLHSIGRHTEGTRVYDRSDGVFWEGRDGQGRGRVCFLLLGKKLDAASCPAIIIIIITTC